MHRLSSLVAVAVVLAACDPVPQTLTLTGGWTGTETASRFLPPEGTLSLSNALDGVITNVSYTGDLEKRVYLFSRPLWPYPPNTCSTNVCFSPTVLTLALPLPTESFGTSSTDIAPDPTKWPGVRAYDIGLCSQNTPWKDFGQQLAEGLLAEFVSAGGVRGARLAGPPYASPILLGREATERDRIGFMMSFSATSMVGSAWGITGGCRGVDVFLSFKMALGTTPGEYVLPERDLDALAEELADWSFGDHPAYDRLTLVEQDLVTDYRPCGGLYDVTCPTAEELDALLGPQ